MAKIKIDRAFVDEWATKYPISSDAHVLNEVGPKVRSRGHYDRTDLSDVMDWKSPRAKGWLAKNEDWEIEAISQAAFEAHELIRHRILTLIRGVGVPVASALLTVWRPEEYTVIDFRAIQTLAAVGEIQFAGDWPRYADYLTTCRAIASHNGCDLRTLDRALWQWSKSHGS